MEHENNDNNNVNINGDDNNNNNNDNNDTPTKQGKEFKKRVNHYLYDNLNRVLCELYFYCEHESNAIECAEIINILSQASLQFHQLQRQLSLLSKANIQNTKSISWNVSSLSPQKLDFCKTFKNQSQKNISNHRTTQNTQNIENEDPNKVNQQKQSSSDSQITPKKPPGLTRELIANCQTKKSQPKHEAVVVIKKPRKEKKVIKCWADYDSESDLDFDSIDDENYKSQNDENGYEQYIKCDIEQSEKEKQKEKDKEQDKDKEKEEEILIKEIDETNKENQEIKQMEVEQIATEPIKENQVKSIVNKAENKVEKVIKIQQNKVKQYEPKQNEMTQEEVKQDESEIVESENVESETTVDDTQNENEVEITENNQEEIEEKEKEESKDVIEPNMVYSTLDYNGRQQKWRKKVVEKETNTTDPNTTNKTSTNKTTNEITTNETTTNETIIKEKDEEIENERDNREEEDKRQKQQRQRKQPKNVQKVAEQEDVEEDGTNDVWFSNEYEPITLNDIMNDESQKLLNKYENQNENKQKAFNRNTHNFPLPFNKMVAKKPQNIYVDKPIYSTYNNVMAIKNGNNLMNNDKFQNKNKRRNNNKMNNNNNANVNNQKEIKIDNFVNKYKNYHKINPNEQLKKTQLKQQKAEKRRLQLREQQNNKWQIVAAKKKQKREELRKQTENKLLLQKQELQNKLISAKLRYEKKMKEKKRKAKEYDMKIKTAAKEKDNELNKKREIQRKSQEEKMKNASQRYKQTISKKKQNANNHQIIKKLDNQQNQQKKIKSQKQQNQQQSKQNDNTNSNPKKKQTEHKKKNNHIHKKRNKNNNNHKKKQQQKKGNNHNNNQNNNNNLNNNNESVSVSSELTFFSFESSSPSLPQTEDMMNIINNNEEIKIELQTLLNSSSEYINGIKAKREWISNCPYSELKSLIQSVSVKINKFDFVNNNDNNDDISLLISIFNDKVDDNNNDKTLESQFGNILKLMDCREMEDASNTYLLMYLIDNIIKLIPYFNKFSLRTQKLLLQCIVNATQKNYGVAQFIIRSKSCLYLLHLLIKQISQNNFFEIDSIIHTLTIAVNSIRDFPDLIDRKVSFYKYVSILKFFNKILFLFSKIIINKSLNRNYDLFLRIIPFIQSVTSFNDKYDDCNDDNMKFIFDVIKDTNFYGLQSLISTLVLETNENNKTNCFEKEKSMTVLRIIKSSFQSINNIARLNLNLFQEIINEIQIEIYHVLSYLLSYLTFHHQHHHHPFKNIQKQQQQHKSRNINDILLNQVILFQSYCCLNNFKFQECFRWGDYKSNLINKLCQLPFNYFNKYGQMKILFPTLITITFKNNANCKILNTMLNKKHLIHFILNTYYQKYKKEESDDDDNIDDKNKNNDHYEFDKRFPIQFWRSAIQFYTQ